MAPATGLLTAEDFAALPTEGMRLELVRGEVQAMSPAQADHGIVAMSGGSWFGLCGRDRLSHRV
jgi:Uma2 family endonuclease